MRQRRVGARSRWVIAGLLSALGVVGAASAQEPAPRFPPVRDTQISLFGGVQFDNVWQDAFFQPTNLEWLDMSLVGLGIGHDWRRAESPFSFGFEFQTVGQFGEQDLVEFNLPVVVRYHTPDRIPVFRSFAFGVGPSYTTKVPRYEIEDGDAQQFMVYWMMEAELGDFASTSLFTRLHHRSGAFGTVADEGSSNAIVWGIRRRW